MGGQNLHFFSAPNDAMCDARDDRNPASPNAWRSFCCFGTKVIPSFRSTSLVLHFLVMTYTIRACVTHRGNDMSHYVIGIMTPWIGLDLQVPPFLLPTLPYTGAAFSPLARWRHSILPPSLMPQQHRGTKLFANKFGCQRVPKLCCGTSQCSFFGPFVGENNMYNITTHLTKETTFL